MDCLPRLACREDEVGLVPVADAVPAVGGVSAVAVQGLQVAGVCGGCRGFHPGR